MLPSFPGIPVSPFIPIVRKQWKPNNPEDGNVNKLKLEMHYNSVEGTLYLQKQFPKFNH